MITFYRKKNKNLIIADMQKCHEIAAIKNDTIQNELFN